MSHATCTIHCLVLFDYHAKLSPNEGQQKGEKSGMGLTWRDTDAYGQYNVLRIESGNVCITIISFI